jgi:hypothetical protein
MNLSVKGFGLLILALFMGLFAIIAPNFGGEEFEIIGVWFEFSEPHIQIRVLKLMLSIIGLVSITIVPILFIWVKIEDKFFTDK